MRTLSTAATLLTVCFSLTGCHIEDFANEERYQSDFRYSYPMNSDAAFTLENYNGSVEISGWDQNTVEITGTKYASSQTARDEIRIDVTRSDNSVSVRTTRPSEHSGNMGARYVIRVPRRVRLERVTSTNGSIRVNQVTGMANLKTSNGSIRAGRIEGNLEAQTTNGPIEAEDITGGVHLHSSNGHVRAESVKGAVEATTTNGGIEIGVNEQLRSDIRAGTTNGSITVHLPAGTAARIAAATSHDRITSDFQVTMQGHLDDHHMTGEINGGGAGSPTIDLTTSNGHIRILKT